MLWFSGDRNEEVRCGKGMILHDGKGEAWIAIMVDGGGGVGSLGVYGEVQGQR